MISLSPCRTVCFAGTSGLFILQSKVQFRNFSLQVLEREQIMNKFHQVTTQLEQALGGVHYQELDISDEVKEQVKSITL